MRDVLPLDNPQRLRLLCATAIFLQALDLLSTALGLAAGAVEHNPLVHAFGWTPMVLAKALAVAGLASLPFLVMLMPLEKRDRFTKQSAWWMGSLCAFYAIVVASNFWVAA